MGRNPVNRPNLFCAAAGGMERERDTGRRCGGSRWARPNNFDFMMGSARAHARAATCRSMVVRPPGGEPGTSGSQSTQPPRKVQGTAPEATRSAAPDSFEVVCFKDRGTTRFPTARAGNDPGLWYGCPACPCHSPSSFRAALHTTTPHAYAHPALSRAQTPRQFRTSNSITDIRLSVRSHFLHAGARNPRTTPLPRTPHAVSSLHGRSPRDNSRLPCHWLPCGWANQCGRHRVDSFTDRGGPSRGFSAFHCSLFAFPLLPLRPFPSF